MIKKYKGQNIMIYILILISIAIYTLFLLGGAAAAVTIFKYLKFKIIATILSIIILIMVYAIGFRISILPIRYYCNNIHETETESIENYKKI